MSVYCSKLGFSVESAFSDNEPLPEVLNLSNGAVLELVKYGKSKSVGIQNVAKIICEISSKNDCNLQACRLKVRKLLKDAEKKRGQKNKEKMEVFRNLPFHVPTITPKSELKPIPIVQLQDHQQYTQSLQQVQDREQYIKEKDENLCEYKDQKQLRQILRQTKELNRQLTKKLNRRDASYPRKILSKVQKVKDQQKKKFEILNKQIIKKNETIVHLRQNKSKLLLTIRKFKRKDKYFRKESEIYQSALKTLLDTKTAEHLALQKENEQLKITIDSLQFQLDDCAIVDSGEVNDFTDKDYKP